MMMMIAKIQTVNPTKVTQKKAKIQKVNPTKVTQKKANQSKMILYLRKRKIIVPQNPILIYLY